MRVEKDIEQSIKPQTTSSKGAYLLLKYNLEILQMCLHVIFENFSPTLIKNSAKLSTQNLL